MSKKLKCIVMCMAHDEGDRLSRLKICVDHFGNADGHGIDYEFAVAYDTRSVKEICQGVDHLFAISNDMPLGERHNRMLAHLVHLEWDYLMQIGSDDVITPSGYSTAGIWMRQGCLFGAFVKLGIVSPDLSKYKLHQGMGNMGAGRFIARSVVEKVLSERSLWPPYIIKGLDGNSEISVAEVAKIQVHPVNTYLPCVFDFKGKSNLHSYDKFGHKERDFNWDMLNL